MNYINKISTLQTTIMHTYTSEAALKILSGSNKSNQRDTVTISNEARNFSEESILEIMKEVYNFSSKELSFYYANRNNPTAILDAKLFLLMPFQKLIQMR